MHPLLEQRRALEVEVQSPASRQIIPDSSLHKIIDRKTRGLEGEDAVCAEIKRRGMRIVERNVRERFAEIDIVAFDRETLCFIEVRTRQDTTLGHPAETVTFAKQNNIRRAAEMYLAKNAIRDVPIRFDVATIIWKDHRFEYFENAF